MKRILYFCLLSTFCIANKANAQLLPIQYDTLTRSQEIILSGGADYCGSAMQNQLTSKLIRGGLITTEIKDGSFNRHKQINRFGGALNGEIEYRNYNIKLFKKKDWGMLVKGGAYVFGGTLYSQDAFGLLFYGNERYLGDTISMSGMDMSLVSFEKIGFGMIDNKSKSNLSINLYNVSNRLSADFRDLEVRQSADGQDVEIVMDGQVELRNNLSYTQGIGLGVDADFKLPISWGKGKAFIQFQAKNVGVAYMLEQQKVYRVDTTISYSGLEFNQLIGDNAIVFDSLNVLDSMGITSSLRNRTVLLPGFVQVGKIVDLHNESRVQSFFGIRLYPTLIYSPYVYAGVDVKAADWLRFGANVGYGGFTNFRGGLYASVNTKNISIGLATENIVGAVSRNGNGQSLYLRLRCAF